jgi:hypothetical protein
MSEYISIITTVCFFSLVYISSIIYSSEFKINITSSRAIFIGIAYTLITFSWIIGIALSIALSIYFVLIVLYIFLRISHFNSVVNHFKRTPILIYPFLIFSFILIINSVLIHYDEGYLAQVSKSIWMGYTNSDDIKYYLLKSFLWSALNSYSDIFNYRIGMLIEWLVFLLFICPLFKRTGNHIIIVLLMILFFMPQTYFTSSYSDGSNAIFLTLVFFATLGLLNGKNGVHELIGPLFLLSVCKSDSLYTIGVFMIAVIVVYLLDSIKKSSEKRQFQFNKAGFVFISCILIIVFNLFIKSMLPAVAQDYSSQYVNKIDSITHSSADESKAKSTSSSADESKAKSSSFLADHFNFTSDSESASNLIMRSESMNRLPVIEDILSGLLINIKASLKELLPNFSDLYSFSIFIVIWLVYIYRHFSKEGKIATKFFFILYVGVFIYINLAYVLVFSKTELDIAQIPSFMRYFDRIMLIPMVLVYKFYSTRTELDIVQIHSFMRYFDRTMLIPMVLVYKFYSTRYDLTKFANNGKIIVLYLIVFPLVSYTQIWRIYKPTHYLVHQEIRGVLQQCNINNLNYDKNVHFIDQTAVGEARVMASMYAYPVSVIGSPCIGKRDDSYCYPSIETHNNWLSYMALYGTEYVAVYTTNDYFNKNLWPKSVQMPSPPFCVRVKDWKIIK